MKGYIDRIVDQKFAVILFDEEKKEITIPVEKLPAGWKENVWVNLVEENGTYRVYSIDEDKTKKEMQKSQDLLAQLRAKSKGSRYRDE